MTGLELFKSKLNKENVLCFIGYDPCPDKFGLTNFCDECVYCEQCWKLALEKEYEEE